MNTIEMPQDTRTHVVGELYDTERSYVESLQILTEARQESAKGIFDGMCGPNFNLAPNSVMTNHEQKYMKPLKSAESSRMLIDSSLVDEIFYTIPEILEHHENFLAALRDRLSSNWDSSQIIGNVFIETFTNQQIIDTYTAFINNWKNARQAIKLASQAKPAFERFLEAMSREHKNKLTLDALLIMPVQRIPRYELLIKELIKHTPEDHPDHIPLLHAQREIHELALKIDRAEKEMIHQEQLRDIEALIDGHIELQNPQREFIRYDLVTILGPNALTVVKKERILFLFCDLLIMTSVKKRASRRSNLQACFANSFNDLSLLEGNKFKLLLRVPLDQVEVRLNNDQIQVQQQQQQEQHSHLLKQKREKSLRDRKRELESDLFILQQISTLCKKLSAEERAKIIDSVNDLANTIRESLVMLDRSDISLASSARKFSSDLCPIQFSSTNAINSQVENRISSTNNLDSLNISNIGSTNSAILSSSSQQIQALNLSTPSAATTVTSHHHSNQHQEPSTSLELLINSANISGGSGSVKDSHLQPNNEPISGEQGYVMARQTNSYQEFQASPNTQSLSNCESLVVTFGSVDRHQAFLHAFIEAKQQRYQQQQRRQRQQQQQQQNQQQRVYSTSAVLRISQPGSQDWGSSGNDPRKTRGRQQDNMDTRFTASSSPLRANKMASKLHASSSAARISSDPLNPTNVCGASLVHQMSGPQSLAILSTSPSDGSMRSSGQLTSCTSPCLTIETERHLHHHHHQLMHQPNGQPASLETICCHDQHNDDLRTKLSPVPSMRTDRMTDSNDLDQSDRQNSCRDLHRHADHLEESSIVSIHDEVDVANPANANLQKYQLMSHMNQLLLIKLAPSFMFTTPLNFLNTQHPALQFTCSTVRRISAGSGGERNIKDVSGFSDRQQTVRDDSGHLWLCMSNGYVSHISLISVTKKGIKKSMEPLNEDCDSNYQPPITQTKTYYNIVPVIQSAGDICKSQINCIAQVPRGRKLSIDTRVCRSSGDLSEPVDCCNQGQASPNPNQTDGLFHEQDLVSISSTNIQTTKGTDVLGTKSQFLSESAPAHGPIHDAPGKVKLSALNASQIRPLPEVDTSSSQPKSTETEIIDSDQVNDNQGTPKDQSISSFKRNCMKLYRASHLQSNQSLIVGHHQHHYHSHNHHHSHQHHLSHGHQNNHHYKQVEQSRNGQKERNVEQNQAGHVANNVYQRHHTVSIGELRKAFERQSRISDPKLVKHSTNHHLIAPTNTPSEFNTSSDGSSNQQRIKSLDLAERALISTSHGDKKSRPLDLPPGNSSNRSFKSARLLRHQASLRTSSILAKLVGSAGKKFWRPVRSSSDRHQSDDNDTDTESGNLRSSARLDKKANVSIDSAQQLTSSNQAMNRYLLNASSPEINNAVISPLSSVSSLVSTNSSMTINSVCASSPNRSMCDLLVHSSSATCCARPPQTNSCDPNSKLATTSNKSKFTGSSESGLRSRSATVPSRTLLKRCSGVVSGDSPISPEEEYPKFEKCDVQIGSGQSFRVSELVVDPHSHDRSPASNNSPPPRDWSQESSLWLGCDDGSLIIIDCLADNLDDDCKVCNPNNRNLTCNNYHVEVKLGISICDIKTYKEKKVLVALTNGQLAIFSRQEDDANSNDQGWQLTSPRIMTIASNELNSRSRICLVGDDHIWYSYGRNIFVLNIETLNLEMTIMAPSNDPSLQLALQTIAIDAMEAMPDLSSVWISFMNGPLLQLYDMRTYKLLTEINLYEPINKVLSHGNEIIRQHKTACLKATALLGISNSQERCSTLFIGTSAGIVLYLSMTHEQLLSQDTTSNLPSIDWNTQIASLRRGHTGPVKFLHSVAIGSADQDKVDSICENSGVVIDSHDIGSRERLLVSGGTGMDLYGPTDEHFYAPIFNSDDDNLNHLILWKI